MVVADGIGLSTLVVCVVTGGTGGVTSDFWIALTSGAWTGGAGVSMTGVVLFSCTGADFGG